MRFLSVILPQLIENGSTQYWRRGGGGGGEGGRELSWGLCIGLSAGRICLETFCRVFPLYLGTDHYFRQGVGVL